MTTLFDVTRSLSKMITRSMSGVATDGTDSTLVDSELVLMPGDFKDGTIWITSGDNAGKALRILSAGGGTITFTTQADPVIAGDTYTISDSTFPLRLLEGTINRVLEVYPVQRRSDDDIVVDTTTPIYALLDSTSPPAFNIRNVLRVEIEEGDADSENWTVLRTWREDPMNQTLTIKGLGSSDDGARLRITYEAKHGEVSGSTEIDPQVDLDYLYSACMVDLWRNYIQLHKKDNATAMDLLNEAKVLEASNRVRLLKPGHFSRDVRLARE